ncbi:hypothetical protein GRI44_10370 [Altererythrobacter confluentis]|uniref:Glucosyltransferase GtrII-like protein n=1 Tax=Allopontixanthobacter confluentis TaxID=1849021 RepID=A0A6L7GGE8_9SPHN|nr:hypothetical protein [Allopontixanthobacter confluentis]MXP15152.1 hypothetical protein [Allopontixanthobacter confluentis]
MTMVASVPALIIAAAGVMTFVISAVQSHINAKHGTDHAVHSFLIRCIRQNNYRLFVRIPNLINKAYIGALPLYLHWIFAHFSPGIMRRAERLINPFMNACQVLLVAMVAGWAAGMNVYFAAICALLFALTPQFYHALSARNFGLSARSLGLFFLTAAIAGGYLVEADPTSIKGWGLLIISCYLIWAFSTFGAQALILISVLAALLTGHFHTIAGAVAGLIVFVCLHPRYSLGYLYHTYRFIRAYSVELAPVYVLSRRYSIWRDIIRDIWIRIAKNPKDGLRYAYENSLIVSALLNPLFIVAILGKITVLGQDEPLVAYACDFALAGWAAMLVTSLRRTRFLGEPERYVEATTPWAVIGGAAVLLGFLSERYSVEAADTAGFGLGLVFLAVVAIQVAGSKILSNYLNSKPHQIEDAMKAISAGSVDGEAVRFCSNNEQYTKLMLPNDWQFSYCIAVGHGYCGMAIGEAFSQFPFLHREALEKIVATYKINACALDRALFEDIFENPPADLLKIETQFLSEGLRVLRLEWASPMTAPATSAVGG